ncbi:MAG TPA: hypothetical protein VNA69_10720 [Thermoanaerobaculia bacterium]|nr:hypothetical protein [Thermoanaerobaculia bacterium]
MEIVFAGICCWVDAKLPNTGKTVIIPNSTRGGLKDGSPIPPHSAFIHAKRRNVEATNWRPAITVGDDDVLFLLEGDAITFDPVPAGGSIDVTNLPHVKDTVGDTPICGAADEIRAPFRDEPAAFYVSGLVDLPADASVTTSANSNGAVFATLHIPNASVTITAKPFNDGGARSLKITDSSAPVFVCNVSMTDYLLGNTADEDNHKFLVCEIFKPRSVVTRGTSRHKNETMMLTELSDIDSPAGDESFPLLKGTPGKDMQDYLCTFAAGCSDSQWP